MEVYNLSWPITVLESTALGLSSYLTKNTQLFWPVTARYRKCAQVFMSSAGHFVSCSNQNKKKIYIISQTSHVCNFKEVLPLGIAPLLAGTQTDGHTLRRWQLLSALQAVFVLWPFPHCCLPVRSEGTILPFNTGYWSSVIIRIGYRSLALRCS